MIRARNEPGRGPARACSGQWVAAQRVVSIIKSMVIDMNETQVRTLEQVRQVLEGTQALEFRTAEDDDEQRYAWIERVLRRLGSRQLGRSDRGAVLAYLQRLSGYNRAQVTRLVSKWMAGKRLVKSYRAPRACLCAALYGRGRGVAGRGRGGPSRWGRCRGRPRRSRCPSWFPSWLRRIRRVQFAPNS